MHFRNLSLKVTIAAMNVFGRPAGTAVISTLLSGHMIANIVDAVVRAPAFSTGQNSRNRIIPLMPFIKLTLSIAVHNGLSAVKNIFGNSGFMQAICLNDFGGIVFDVAIAP